MPAVHDPKNLLIVHSGWASVCVCTDCFEEPLVGWLESPTIPPGARAALRCGSCSVFFSGTLTKLLVDPGDEARWEVETKVVPR